MKKFLNEVTARLSGAAVGAGGVVALSEPRMLVEAIGVSLLGIALDWLFSGKGILRGSK